MLKTAIIITVHGKNGKEIPCVEACRRQIDAIGDEERYSFSTFINDQGRVGLPAIWEEASKDKYDFYVFMDSDLDLAEGALATFLENSEFLRHKAVIGGSVTRDKALLFGGRTKRGKMISPDPLIPVPCRFFDMELAFIPRHAFSQLANPLDMFRRSVLDYGYGSAAVKAEVARVLAPGVLATTSRETEIPVWKNTDNDFRTRISSLYNAARGSFLRFVRSLFASH